MTEEQVVVVRDLLRRIKRKYQDYELWLHHGDCVGADAEVHSMAIMLGYKVKVHPPLNEKARAWCIDYSEIAQPQIYSVRNADIVRESKLLIAVPHNLREPNGYRGSGTWGTTNYARRRKKSHVIVFSDGRKEGSKWRKLVFQPNASLS